MARLLLLLLAVVGVASAQQGRVVVLGFDGADARTVEGLIAQGQLPNLKVLAEAGTFAPMRSTHPAESAAGWAAINTGTNPLKNRVPGFLRRSSDGSPTVEAAHLVSGPEALVRSAPEGESSLLLALAAALGGALLGFFVTRGPLGRPGGPAIVAAVVLGGAAGAAVGLVGGEDEGPTVLQVPNVVRSAVAEDGFWDHAAAAGKRALVLDAALAFGLGGTEGARVLGGLGVPDASGSMNGRWVIYSTDEDQLGRPPEGTRTRSGGIQYRVDERDGRVTTRLFGPPEFAQVADEAAAVAELEAQGATGDPLAKAIGVLQTAVEASRVAVPMVLERRGAALEITIDGQTQTVAAGAWSDWFHPVFPAAEGVDVHAVTRVRVLSVEAPMEVYVDALHLDPSHPSEYQPLASPPEFAADLARWTGEPYETVGWSCMTNQMKDRVLPVEVFLEDVEFTMRWRERLTRACLERDDWELLFSVFSSLDRVQHVLYRSWDEGHPRHDPEEAAREVTFFGERMPLRDVIPAMYAQVDRVVGEVVAKLRPEDQLLLCADHGFTSFRWGFQVNHWLAKQGYLALKPPAQLLQQSGGNVARLSLTQCVDWSQTRAFSLGLGMIYLNLQGRDPSGIVPRAGAKALLKEIEGKLLTAQNPGPAGAPFPAPIPAVRDVAIMDEEYAGATTPWGSLDWPCSDLMLGLSEHHRVSWESVRGELLFERKPNGRWALGSNFRANQSPWSGDHASTSPDVVTGIFFARHPVAVPDEGVSVLHVAPTVLDELGVAVPERMDLAPLTRRQ